MAIVFILHVGNSIYEGVVATNERPPCSRMMGNAERFAKSQPPCIMHTVNWIFLTKFPEEGISSFSPSNWSFRTHIPHYFATKWSLYDILAIPGDLTRYATTCKYHKSNQRLIWRHGACSFFNKLITMKRMKMNAMLHRAYKMINAETYRSCVGTGSWK